MSILETNNLSLHKFEQHHLKTVATLATDAFFNDPGYFYIFQSFSHKKEKKQKVFCWFLERYLWFYLKLNSDNFILHSDNTNQNILGFVCLHHPHDKQATALHKIQAGILLMPLKTGGKAFKRALKTADAFDELEERILWKELSLDKNHYSKIEQVAIRVDSQGKGFGKGIVEQCLKIVQEKGFGCYLLTQQPLNIKFYEKLGFEMVGESCVDTSCKDSSIFLMLHKKKPTFQ